jgi:hypothetical protein
MDHNELGIKLITTNIIVLNRRRTKFGIALLRDTDSKKI